MGSEELLTEEQSAKLAGVSAGTIRRFQEFGLLAYADVNARLFKKADVLSLFRAQTDTEVKRAANSDLSSTASIASRVPLGSSPSAAVGKDPSPALDSEAVQAAPLTVIPGGRVDQQKENNSETVNSSDVTTASVAAENPGSKPTSHAPLPENPSASVAQQSTEAADQPAAQATPQAAIPNISASSAPLVVAQAQYSAVAPQSDLLEVNKLLREQIQSLKDERDWLRERLEKLEALSEREHMLLFSNSETIRQLLAQQPQQKRGFWANALPWLKPR